MGTKYREIEEPEEPIPVRQLIIGTRLPCDMFIREDNTLKLFFNKNILYTKISQDILREKNISEVFIYMRDVPNLDFYISRNRPANQNSDIDNRVTFKEYAFQKEQHYQIDPTVLKPGTNIHFTLSVLDNLNLSQLVEASEEYPAVVSDSILKVAGDVVIKKSDVPRYLEYISSLRQYSKHMENTETRIKATALRETSKAVLQNFLDDPKSGEKIKEIDILVNDMIDCILQDKDAIYMLLSMKGYDYYTYTHSVNVAALSISLGVLTGLKQDDMQKLGMGAMLHDIGKSQISHEILGKQGKLSDAEYRMIKNHVIEGERIMRSHADFSAESLNAISQHHEKLSGKGYPSGLTGKEISFFGRISAIADCYDALTTRRPYKVAYTPFYALLMISKDTGDYDPELLTTFIKMLGKIK
ncbi:MAG: HD-GYP domain-containing protein [Dissulfurispiraceae bacterium]|jgi:putative nucleotidyltransferase with HDIG domain